MTGDKSKNRDQRSEIRDQSASDLRSPISDLRSAFTVAEMLVVIALFTIASLAVTATYVNYMRLQRRTSNAEILGEELRYIGELIVRAVRNNRISYVGAPLPYSSNTLNLVDASGNTITIRFLAAASCTGLNVTSGCLTLTSLGNPETSLTGKNIDITQFAVYVQPNVDPYTPSGLGVYASNQQPYVTFFIQARYNAPNAREQATMTYQTSVASRIYTR
ncbi:MAG: hypothetical protein WC477_00640 [Patescibacteria group bacterium]